MPEELRPATYTDLITAAAKANKIPPELALAVAQKESGFNPAAKSPKGAVGIMQLMPDTAKELGVDPLDPQQNIQGGVKYLATLRDRYQGDVSKMLQAYNGGMGNIDKGIIPAESQAYAADIMATLSAGQRTQAAPAVGKTGPAATAPVQPSAGHEDTQPGMLRQMLSAMDPRTPEGRVNIAGATGGIVGGSAGTLTSPVTGPVGPAAGAILGAGTAGALEQKYLEPLLTGKPAEGTALEAGATQAAQELGGEALMWPMAKAARIISAHPIAQRVTEVLGEKSRAAREAGAKLVGATREKNQAALDAVIDAGKLTADRVRTFGRDAVARVRNEQTGKVAGAEFLAAGHVRQAEKQAAETLGQAEADAAASVANASAAVSRIKPPSTLAAGDATRATLGGIPKLLDVEDGPLKTVIDATGQRIEAAAADKNAPRVNISGPKAKLQQMLAKAFPSSLSGKAPEAATGIGFLRNASGNIRSAAAASAEGGGFKGASAADHAILQQKIAAALGVEPTHPVTGVLADMAYAPDDISFAEAHILKKRFYEAVNFDQTAKKAIDGITKATGSSLREAMTKAGNTSYEAANAEFRALADLHRKGVGKQLVNLAATAPDKVASVLRFDQPAAASAVRDLLLTGAETDAKGSGQAAWDGIRSIFTHKNILSKGADGLTERIADMEANHPEFVKAVYGDETGQQVLANFKKLGAAYDAAVARTTQDVAAAKAAGATAVETAATGAKGQVAGAKSAARGALAAEKAQSATAVSAAEDAARTARRGQRTANAQALGQALQTSAAGKEAVRQDAQAFTRSSMHKFAGSKAIEDEASDLLRVGALGPGQKWGALAMIRLLGRDASMSDLAQWAAYSGRNLNLVTKILNNQLSDRAAANVVREALGAINPPQASHERAIASSKAKQATTPSREP